MGVITGFSRLSLYLSIFTVEIVLTVVVQYINIVYLVKSWLKYAPAKTFGMLFD